MCAPTIKGINYTKVQPLAGRGGGAVGKGVVPTSPLPRGWARAGEGSGSSLSREETHLCGQADAEEPCHRCCELVKYGT